MRFLLDTNVISEPLRAQPNAGIMQRLKRHSRDAGICSLVWHELWFGLERLEDDTRRSAIRAYLHDVVQRNFAILDYDEEAAKWHAQERVRRQRQGRTAPFVDGQIASIASVHDLTLVTKNTRDFRYFAGLKVADWQS